MLSDDPPVAVVIVDTDEQIRAFLPELEKLDIEGLVILEPVDVIRYAGRGAHGDDQLHGQSRDRARCLRGRLRGCRRCAVKRAGPVRSNETTRSASCVPDQHVQPGESRLLGAVAAGWLLTGAVIVLAVLTVALAAGLRRLDQLDTRVADWGYRATYGHQGLSDWWQGVAASGKPMMLWISTMIGSLFLAWRRCWALAGWLVGITGAENVIAPLVKHLLSRPRPHWLEPIAVEHSLSLPSGHATAAGTYTAAATTILALATLSTGWLRRLAILSAVLVGLTISVDRMYLGVHYLSEVIAGNILRGAGERPRSHDSVVRRRPGRARRAMRGS